MFLRTVLLYLPFGRLPRAVSKREVPHSASLAHPGVPQCGGSGVWGSSVGIASVLPLDSATPFALVVDPCRLCSILIGRTKAEPGSIAIGLTLLAHEINCRRMPYFSGADENGPDVVAVESQNALFTMLWVEDSMSVYSFEGFQVGFRFSAKAFRPSRAFSPD
jgi:hypothetical protein